MSIGLPAILDDALPGFSPVLPVVVEGKIMYDYGSNPFTVVLVFLCSYSRFLEIRPFTSPRQPPHQTEIKNPPWRSFVEVSSFVPAQSELAQYFNILARSVIEALIYFWVIRIKILC
jgi:hypothetical protein